MMLKKIKERAVYCTVLLCMAVAGHAQDVTVSGTAVDEDKQILPGVNILVVGTTTGTTTDADGRFELNVPSATATLRFSYVGYQTQKVRLEGRTELGEVVMQAKIFESDEMVVTGYESVHQRQVTGSVSSISEEDLESLPITNVASILGSQSTGLQSLSLSGAPGGRGAILVRGNTSISRDLNANTAFSNPLYVIDGVQTSLDNLPGYYQSNQDFLASLNPKDIKSIDILKDASATAIYGSRGANGVIIIETKGGMALSEPEFSFSTSVGIQPQPDLVNMLIGSAERQRKMEMISRWWPYENKLSNDTPIMLSDSLNPAFNNNVDYQGLFYQTGVTQKYDLSMRGGNETNAYRVSFGYNDNQGVVNSTGFDRYTLNADLNTKFNENFSNTLQAKVYYTDNQTGQGNPFQGPFNLNSTLPVDPASLNSSLFRLAVAQRQSLVGELESKKNTDQSIQTTLTNFARFQFWKGLAFNSQLTFVYNSNKKNYYEPSTIRPQNDGFASYSTSSHRKYSADNYLNFNSALGQYHELTAIAGSRINYNRYEDLGLSAIGRGSDAIQVINSRYSQDEIGGFSDLSANSLVSFYGRLRYVYRDRYILTGNFSRDGSSRFGSNVRWANFPSVAVGWIFSDEPFLEQITSNFLDYGKVKFSWGVNGKQFQDNYLRFGSYNLGYGGTPHWTNQMDVSSYGGVTGIIPNYDSIANEDLSWENSTQWNVGVELEMFNHRLNATFDAYNKKTEELFFAINFPAYSGYNSAKANVAGVQNMGWEARVNYHVFPRSNDFNLRLSAGFSHNENYVSNLPNGGRDYFGSDYGYVVGRPINLYKVFVNNGILNSLDDLPINPYTGEPLHGKPNGAWSYTRAGLPIWVDINGDNYLDEQSDIILSRDYSPTPDLIGSFNINTEYKSWFLRVYSQFSFGSDIKNTVLNSYLNNYDRGGAWSYTGLADLSQYKIWNGPEDTDAELPALVPNTDGISPFYSFRGTQTLWIESGDYWKISNATLGYNFPPGSGLLAKTGLSELRIYASATNLWQWQRSDRVVDASLVDAKGHLLGNGYPQPMTVSFGIDVTF